MVLQEWVDKETEELMAGMRSKGFLKSSAVEKAIITVPRWMFVPRLQVARAYRDAPLEIREGQTISQPSTVVIMTEALDARTGQRILEVGTGSGWQAGLLAKIIGPAGKIYSVERLASLAESAKRNLENAGIKNVEIFIGDGSLGLKEKAPFDRIIVTAAVPEVPEPLVEQLRVGGKIVVPVGDLYSQKMIIVEKLREGSITRKDIGAFTFVPLIGRYGFRQER